MKSGLKHVVSSVESFSWVLDLMILFENAEKYWNTSFWLIFNPRRNKFGPQDPPYIGIIIVQGIRIAE